METICDVEIINPDQNGLVDLNHLEELLIKYADRKMKIAVTALLRVMLVGSEITCKANSKSCT
ncbi:MAG: hypothetical protein R2771_05525 [Saprospiraceae bacterium]